jgi:hypothetical protein
MVSVKRGGVFLVNFDPTVGAEAKKTRPAVVVGSPSGAWLKVGGPSERIKGGWNKWTD